MEKFNEDDVLPIMKFLKRIDNMKENLKLTLNDYFRDSLIALLVINRDSGKVPYNYIRDELVEPDLIGGFLTAIQDFGNEILSKCSPIRELCYKDFQIKIEDGKYTSLVIILLNNPGNLLAPSISEKMKDFLISFELLYRINLKNWRGRTDCFDEADLLVKEFFFNPKKF